MSLIDVDSAECTKTELEIFKVPPTQTSIEKSRYVKHHPITSLSKGSPVEFRCRTSGTEYLDLSSLLLYTKNRIIRGNGEDLPALDAGAMPDRTKVSVCNYFGSTRWKSVDVHVNGRCLSDSNNLYSYRAIMELLLSYNSNALKSQFAAAMFEMDEGVMDNVTHSFGTEAAARTNGNRGTWKRFDRTKASQVFECIGPIHSELFTQGKFLVLNNCELKILLRQHDPNFALMALDENENYTMEIQEACLFVEHKEINKQVLEAHEMVLQKANAKFPISRTEMKYYTFGNNRSDLSLQNLHTGQIPRKLFFCMVENSAFSGSLHKNPFNFKHLNASSVALRVDGIPLPFEALKLDFGTKNYGQAYTGLLHATNKLFKQDSLAFSLEDFGDGYTLFGFNLVPDGGECAFSLVKEGSLSLDIKLGAATTEATTVICLLQFDDILHMNSNKEIS